MLSKENKENAKTQCPGLRIDDMITLYGSNEA